MPVSYTHLDVYKRQLFVELPTYHIAFGNVFKWICCVCSFLNNDRNSVSFVRRRAVFVSECNVGQSKLKRLYTTMYKRLFLHVYIINFVCKLVLFVTVRVPQMKAA